MEPLKSSQAAEQELRFMFRLKAHADNTGLNSFQDKSLVIIVKNELIDHAIILGVGLKGECSLKVVERSVENGSIYLEDSLGLLRLVLKMDDQKNEYLIMINHPSNLYHIEPIIGS